jgi:hypothetical protein
MKGGCRLSKFSLLVLKAPGSRWNLSRTLLKEKRLG